MANKPARPKKTPYPVKYTASSMAQFISAKHELSQSKSKEIIDDLFELISTGVMKGERVPVGKMGKIYFSVRPARRARMGRNPATGEEIKIPAKKATKVPKFSFSKAFKESVLRARIQKKSG